MGCSKVISNQKGILVAVVAIMGLTACSKSGSGDDSRVVEDQNNPVCETEPQEGTTIRVEDYLGKQRLAKASFGKEFNEAYLEAVRPADAGSTAAFILANKVNLKRIEASGSRCKYFTGLLTLADRDDESEWKTVSSKIKKGRLAGLYLPSGVANSAGTPSGIPTILVSEDVERWTLVHEFMHHLFQDRAKALGRSLRVSQAKLREAFEKLDRLKDEKGTDLELSRKRASITKDLYVAFDEVMVGSTLEEVTIENKLRRDYEAGTLKSVGKRDYKSAAWYLKTKAEDFEGTIESLQSALDDLELSFQKLGVASDSQIKADLAIVKSLFITRKSELRSISLDVSTALVISNLGEVGLGATTSELESNIKPSHKDCAHSHEAETEAMSLISDYLK